MSVHPDTVPLVTSAEVAITAALGASFLTGFASLGVVWVRELLRRRTANRAALHAAMVELLNRSLAFAARARAVGDTMRLRSGLTEGLDVTLHHRKPVDPLELHDWMAQDLAPLITALSEIWTRCDQEGIRLANDVVNKCMDLLAASTTLPAGSRSQRIRTWAVGVRWTPQTLAAYDRALKDLTAARKRFGEYARGKLGRDAVDLFAQVEKPETGAASQSARRPSLRPGSVKDSIVG